MFVASEENQIPSSSLDSGLSYAFALKELAAKIHSDETRLTYFKRSAKLFLNGLRHRREFNALRKNFDCPELTGVLAHFPSLLEKPFYPYVSVDWNLAKRWQALENHFLSVKEIFGTQSFKIYRPEGYQLFEFVSSTDEVFSVELFPGYQNEGSMGIRLCDAVGAELYSLTFHLDSSHIRSITIGALQGPNDRIQERQKKIAMLTKSLFGLRPKALMIEVLFMVASNLRVEKIYGVSNKGHIYQSDYYSDSKRAQKIFDGDKFWSEFNAEKTSELLFEFPNVLTRKDLTTIKSSKRSQYRKRYAWLDEAEYFVRDALEDITQNFPQQTQTDIYSQAA